MFPSNSLIVSHWCFWKSPWTRLQIQVQCKGSKDGKIIELWELYWWIYSQKKPSENHITNLRKEDYVINGIIRMQLKIDESKGHRRYHGRCHLWWVSRSQNWVIPTGGPNAQVLSVPPTSSWRIWRPHAYTDIMEPWGWGWHNRFSVRRTLGEGCPGINSCHCPFTVPASSCQCAGCQLTILGSFTVCAESPLPVVESDFTHPT